ncbi:YqeG family HAD IIIA-type phosphatase [Natronospora cellulosivora (SeqCode)]
MINKLQPDQYYRDVYKIDLDLLKEKGIKGLIFDIDNTIIPWSEKAVVKELLDFFDEINNEGFEICLVSNGKDKRVKFFSEELKLPAIGQAIKPSKRAFKKAQNILGLKTNEIAVIGDQIFTDVLGGNRMGYTTILVDPLSEKELISTKVMRSLEKIVFKGRGKYE